MYGKYPGRFDPNFMVSDFRFLSGLSPEITSKIPNGWKWHGIVLRVGSGKIVVQVFNEQKNERILVREDVIFRDGHWFPINTEKQGMQKEMKLKAWIESPTSIIPLFIDDWGREVPPYDPTIKQFLVDITEHDNCETWFDMTGSWLVHAYMKDKGAVDYKMLTK